MRCCIKSALISTIKTRLAAKPLTARGQCSRMPSYKGTAATTGSIETSERLRREDEWRSLKVSSMSGDKKREKLMKNISRLFLAPTIAAFLLSLACTTTNAAHRGGRSAYDGTWSVAIYTLRGDCGSVRVAAQIVGGRVYSKDQSYQANGAVGANGVIRVSVASGRLSASGSGRLSRNSGAGSWRSSRGECSGSWSASRRAAYY
jgi:hypothetical protein